MYIIPLTNSPNQNFNCVIPINGENRSFNIKLWYNEQAEYWLMSLTDVKSGVLQFDNLPLLTSNNNFFNILCQLKYMNIGICGVLPRVVEFKESMPNDKNIGEDYILIWGDNK